MKEELKTMSRYSNHALVTDLISYLDKDMRKWLNEAKYF
jgi:hypothetical protein